MSAILLYSMKSALVLGLLYLPYMLMLRRESFFRFNRLVLLGILGLSLVLPLCNVRGLSLDGQPVVQAAQMQMLELGIPVHVLPEVVIAAQGPAAEDSPSLSLFTFVSLIYIIGVAVVLLVRSWQIYRLGAGLQRGSLWTQKEGDITIYCHADPREKPFSWMRSIVLSEADYEEAGREIILHETGHIRNRHSLDVLLLTAVEMLQWWNPLVYMLGISLRDVHEYEADNYVLRRGVSAPAYQLLLIKKAVGSGSYAFANNFNHSLTKKRITMMKNPKSNPWMRSKALYILPVATLALSAFATPKFVAPIESAVTNLGGKGTVKRAESQTGLSFSEREYLRSSDVSGGKVTENSANLQTSGEKSSETASEERKTVHVKEGTMRLVVDGKEMTPEKAMKAVRGKSVKNSLSTGSDGSVKLSIETSATAEKSDSIYDVVAHNAEFPGGEVEFFKFLSQNMRYPKLCQGMGFSGRVIMQFVVEKDGSITEISKLRGPEKKLTQSDIDKYKEKDPEGAAKLQVGQDLGDLLVEESIRVLKLMPKWKPARNEKDEVVRSRFNVPFLYRLN